MVNYGDIGGLSNNSNISDMSANIHVVATRNIFLGTLSIIISMASGFLIVATKLRRPVKILLVNLVACDIVVMASGVLLGLHSRMGLDSDHAACLGVVYLLVFGFITCHSSVTAISINNLLAIFHPYKYKLLVTSRTVMMAVLGQWLLIAIISIGCVGFSLPPGLPCTPLVTVHRIGLTVIAVFMLIADMCVIFINTALCIRLRLSRQVQPQLSSNELPHGDRYQDAAGLSLNPWVAREASTSGIGSQGSDILQSDYAEISHTNSPKRFPPSPRQNLSPATRRPMGGLAIATIRSSILLNSPGLTTDTSLDSNEGDISQTTVPMQTMGKRLRNSKYCFIRKSQSTIQPRKNQQTRKHLFPTRPQLHESNNTSNLVYSRQMPGSSQTVINVNNPVRDTVATSNDRLRRLSVGMIIIGLWCTIFNLPFLMFIFYLATMAENRTKTNYSEWGMMSTTLLAVNVFGDPVIYAWRFVNWRAISMKIQRLCNR